MWKLKRKLKSFQDRLAEFMVVYACRSGFIANIYFVIFSSAFTREHLAVLNGKAKHIKQARQFKSNYFLLVRNTHRLEKGLLMRPRRELFALDYIVETVDSFVNIYSSEKLSNNAQLDWFRDVLQLYFESVKLTPYLAKQREVFLNHIQGYNDVTQEKKSVPYFRVNQSSSISFDEFYKLTKKRRSVRWFLNRPVPRELIDKAILAANQSPSACNRQPFEYRVFDNPSLVSEVVGYPMGTKGYGHSIPVIIVVVGNLDAYFDERDRHVIYVDASLANMTLMLALETLGLSSCSINWPDIESREKKMESFLKLEKYQRPIMCLGVGYADPEGMVAFSEKRPLSQIRKYNL